MTTKHPRKTRSGSGLGITCPHCQQRALLRCSNIMSALVREKTYRCTNDECDHVFIAVEEIQRTVVPPRIACPDINLPLSKVNGHLSKGEHHE